MPNPVFLIVLFFVAGASIICITDYFRGLKIFFCYLMLAGFLKRLMNVFGIPSGVEYSLFVGFALILFTSVLLGFILQRKRTGTTVLGQKRPMVWYLYLFLLAMLIIGIFRSPLPLLGTLVTFLISFFWMLAFPIGFRLRRDQVIEVIRLFVITAIPISLYGLFQFFHGPFRFEVSSVDVFSAVSDWETGSFRRATPTYDSFEPQAVHLVTAFLFAGWRPLRLPRFTGAVVRILVPIALAVSGNRGGLLLLASALVLYLLYRIRGSRLLPKRRLVIALFSVFLLALNFLYVPFQDIAEVGELVFVAGSGSDFGERLGAIYTFSDRLVGRQNAVEHASLFGVGTGYNYATGTIRNKPGFTEAEWYLPGSAVGGLWAHDLIGEMLIDLGLLGVAVFLLLCFTYIWRTTSKTPMDYTEARLLAGVSAIFLSAIVTAAVLGGSYFWNRQGAFLWMMAGFCMPKTVMARKSQSPKKVKEPGPEARCLTSPRWEP